jgi:hypothetical protein
MNRVDAAARGRDPRRDAAGAPAAPPDIVLDCLLGNHPLPFGPSDDQELRCARHGYADSPPSAAVAALSALDLAEGDVFYDLGSGLAAIGSRARCRGIEVHAAYVDPVLGRQLARWGSRAQSRSIGRRAADDVC